MRVCGAGPALLACAPACSRRCSALWWLRSPAHGLCALAVRRSPIALPQAALNTALLLAASASLVLPRGQCGCAWLVTACDASRVGACCTGRCCCRWRCRPTSSPSPTSTCCIPSAWCRVRSAGCWATRARAQFRAARPALASTRARSSLLGFVLYPYRLLTARAMFMPAQPAHLLEGARTLGENRLGAFPRVAPALARPALAVGLSLSAARDARNDIGASRNPRRADAPRGRLHDSIRAPSCAARRRSPAPCSSW